MLFDNSIYIIHIAYLSNICNTYLVQLFSQNYLKLGIKYEFYFICLKGFSLDLPMSV